MRRAVLCLLVAGLIALISQAAFGADTATISVSVTLQSVGLTVDPTAWALGVMAPEEIKNTTGGYFTATNAGNVSVDLTVSTAATSPSSWAPAAAVDVDKYVLDWGVGVTPSWTNITTTPGTLTTGVSPGDPFSFDLRFQAPKAGSTYDADGEAFTVTLAATA